jgi:hypothetical protein
MRHRMGLSNTQIRFHSVSFASIPRCRNTMDDPLPKYTAQPWQNTYAIYRVYELYRVEATTVIPSIVCFRDSHAIAHALHYNKQLISK